MAPLDFKLTPGKWVGFETITQTYYRTTTISYFQHYTKWAYHRKGPKAGQRWYKRRVKKKITRTYRKKIRRKVRFKKFEPLEKPLWRVHGGYTTSFPDTPQGNVRVVKYVEGWTKPGEPGERWARKTMQNTSGQFRDGTKMGNWVDQLTKHGDWSVEVEMVDRVELPAGYEKGRWYVEVFRARGGPPEGVAADYWRRAYGV